MEPNKKNKLTSKIINTMKIKSSIDNMVSGLQNNKSNQIDQILNTHPVIS